MSSNQQAVKEGLARMLKGGVIMDVVNAEQVLFCIIRFVFYRVANASIESFSD